MVKPEREKQQAAETSGSGSGSGSGSSESKYKGVRKRKWGKWVSEIRLPNSRERIWLGSYDSAEKAARAFDAALFCLRGSSAKFNFPDNPPDIAGGRTIAPHEIQAAAQRFANSDSPIANPRHSSSSSSLSYYSSSSSSSSSSVMRVDFPTPSVLDGPAQLDTGSGLDGSDLFTPIGSDNFMTGSYEMFQGFDDFICNDYFMPPLPNFDYPEENYDGSYSLDPFL